MKIQNYLLALLATFVIVFVTGCANATVASQTVKQTVSVQNSTPYRLDVSGVIISAGQSGSVTVVICPKRNDVRNTLREEQPGVRISASVSHFGGGCLPVNYSVGECWKTIALSTTNLTITPKDFGQ